MSSAIGGVIETYSIVASGVDTSGALFFARAGLRFAAPTSEADALALLHEAAAMCFLGWPEIEFTLSPCDETSGAVVGLACPARHVSRMLGLLETVAVFGDRKLAVAL